MRAIFISYRRDDTEGYAGRLFRDLRERFGKDAVFMDVAGIEPGRDFRRVIEDQVASCGVLLAVIGKAWLTTTDEHGKRRLDDPNDFVRLETASALKRDIPVIPVLVQQTEMLREDQLPEGLKDLAFRNSVELTHARWESDVELLIAALQRYVDPPAAGAAAAPPAKPPAAGGEQAPRNQAWLIAPLSVLALGGVAYVAWDRLGPDSQGPKDIAPEGARIAAASAAGGSVTAAPASAPAAPLPVPVTPPLSVAAPASQPAPASAPAPGPAPAVLQAPAPERAEADVAKGMAPSPAAPAASASRPDRVVVATAPIPAPAAPRPAPTPAPAAAAPRPPAAAPKSPRVSATTTTVESAGSPPAPAPYASPGPSPYASPAPPPYPSPAPAPVVTAAAPAPAREVAPARGDRSTELLGMRGAPSTVTRTIVITPSMPWVNVNWGDVVRFEVGDKSFIWQFNGTRTSFDLQQVAPEVLSRKVTVYVAPDTGLRRR